MKAWRLRLKHPATGVQHGWDVAYRDHEGTSRMRVRCVQQLPYLARWEFQRAPRGPGTLVMDDGAELAVEVVGGAGSSITLVLKGSA